jgi:hypothetical protein
MSKNPLLDRILSNRSQESSNSSISKEQPSIQSQAPDKPKDSLVCIEIDSSQNNAPIRYQDFIFFLEDTILKKRIDLEITHPSWNTTRFIPFYHFDKNGKLANQNDKSRQLMTIDLVIDSKVNGLELIEYINKANDITYTLLVNQIPKHKLHISAMNWFSVDNLIEHIENALSDIAPYDTDILFDVMEFKNFLHAKINKLYSKHVFQIDPRYIIIGAYLDTKLFQKVLSFEFTSITNKSFNLNIYRSCEHKYRSSNHHEAHHVVHDKKKQPAPNLPFTLKSIIFILDQIKLFLYTDCPRLYPQDIEYIEGVIVAMYNNMSNMVDYDDFPIKRAFEKYLLLP